MRSNASSLAIILHAGTLPRSETCDGEKQGRHHCPAMVHAARGAKQKRQQTRREAYRRDDCGLESRNHQQCGQPYVWDGAGRHRHQIEREDHDYGGCCTVRRPPGAESAIGPDEALLEWRESR